MKMTTMAGRMLAAVSLLALAGCGGEPSEGDMRDALQAQVDQANKMAASYGATGAKTVLEDFKKVGCAKAKGTAAYACTVTVRMKGPMVDASGTTEMRFAKGEDGWVVVQ